MAKKKPSRKTPRARPTQEPEVHVVPKGPRPRAEKVERASDPRLSFAPSDPPTLPDFPIVGVGASAGGLEAFSQLVRALPSDFDLPAVLVQHLSPGHESLIPNLLHGTTHLKAVQATGVVVSGSASDGAAGILKIEALRGIRFAQKPETAKHEG